MYQKLQLFSILSMGICAATAKRCVHDADIIKFKVESTIGIIACAVIVSALPF